MENVAEKIKLDAKDRQLLYELDKNARQPISKLAKKIRLSQPAVANRLQRLISRGIIKKFFAIINVSELGYFSHRVYIRYQKIDPEKEKEMIAYLLQHPSVFWFASLSGRWDLEILIFARNFYDFTKTFNEIRTRYEEYWGSYVLSIVMYNFHFKRRYLLDTQAEVENPMPYYGGEPKMNENVDETDLRILKYLGHNARLPTVEIAGRMDVSENTVKYRIKKLEKSGIIQTYRIWFDAEKIGYEVYKSMISLHNLTEEKEKAILRFCKGIPNTLYLIRCAGPWDIEIELEVKNNEEYRNIMLDFRKQFSDIIKDYETALIYKEHKINYFPMETELHAS